MRILATFAALAAFASPLQAATPATSWSVFTPSSGGALTPGRDDGATAPNGRLAAVDAAGNLFVVATQGDLTAPCIVTLKYAAATGAVAWRRQACAGGLTFGAALAVDGAGDVVVAGAAGGVLRAIKYSGAGGTPRWDRALAGAGQEAAYGLALDARGDAFIAAYSANLTTDVKVLKLRAADGTVAWQAVIDEGDDEQPSGIAVDAAGDVVVAGSFRNPRGDHDWFLRKLAGASGAPLWHQVHDSGDRDRVAAIAVDAAGSIVATGAARSAQGVEVMRVVKYLGSGAHAWTRDAGPGIGQAVVADGSGAVYVTGRAGSGMGTLKYTAAGALAWSARPEGDGEGRALALDAQGHVTVTGRGYAPGRAQPEIRTVKYVGGSGVEMWRHGQASSGFSPEDAGHAVAAAGQFAYVVGTGIEGDGPTGLRVMRFGATGIGPRANVQGLWWGAPAGSESGWGVNLTLQGEVLFATWFTYGADGQGMWLVMPRGERSGANAYTGVLYRTRGPAFGERFDPAKVVAAPVGNAWFDFADADNGTFRYAVDGVAAQKAITRQQFAAPAPTCTLGGVAPAAPNYQDLWWSAPAGAESGWGLNVAHQGDTLFVTWFTYGRDGEGMWLVGPDFRRTGAGAYEGTLYRTVGPPLGSAFDPARVRGAAAGTARLAFGDAASGVFTYRVDGVEQSKPITRQVFAAPASVCR